MDLDKVRSEVIGNVVAAIIISLLFFFISDFVFSPPNLNGKWEMVLKIDDTKYSKYEGLMLKYDVYLVQNGDQIEGTAEKIGEIKDGEINKYSSPIRSEVKGSITKKYFDKDILNIHILEYGQNRTTSSYFKLTRFSDEYMAGSFTSSAAKSEGNSEWFRLIDNYNDFLNNLN